MNHFDRLILILLVPDYKEGACPRKGVSIIIHFGHRGTPTYFDTCEHITICVINATIKNVITSNTDLIKDTGLIDLNDNSLYFL
jgi:hypothetical protein